MKIGLLTIATNKYTDFVNNLYMSADKYFCNQFEVTYFLFTNNNDFSPQSKREVKIMPVQHEKWPMSTLKRYHFFNQYKNELYKVDYIYYCDADMLFVNTVSKEIISDKVATIHPGFYNKQRSKFTYESREESKAYIPKNRGKRYYAGGFNGGSSKSFLKMSKIIAANVDEDMNKNIIALWHDESHLNHYYNMVTKPTRELTPSYCYPEKWKMPFRKILLALDKNHSEYQV
jgi:hypothetical protein